MPTGYVSGFHLMPIPKKREIIKQRCGLTNKEAEMIFGNYQIDLEKIGENSIGVFPEAIRVVQMKMNDEDYFVPLVVEEASVVAGLSYAAELAYKTGGVKSVVLEKIHKGHFLIYGKEDFSKIKKRINNNEKSYLDVVNADQRHSHATKIYTIPHNIGEKPVISVVLEFDPADAMGAAKAGQLTEKLAELISKDTGCSYVGAVVSNFSGRRTRADIKLPISSLGRKKKTADGKDWSGKEIAERVELLSGWARRDPSRAITNNKGIMNGVIGLARATAQDTRAIEAACGYLYQERGCPLSSWYIDNDYLVGTCELLLPVGIVGGEIKKYPAADVLLNKVLGVESANEFAEVMAAVGLLQNYAALSMLSSIGVSVGHGEHR